MQIFTPLFSHHTSKPVLSLQTKFYFFLQLFCVPLQTMDANLYIINITDTKAQYDEVCKIITALILLSIGKVDRAHIKSYKIDDSQTIIETDYNSLADITKAIQYWKTFKQELLNQLNGRSFVLRNAANL